MRDIEEDKRKREKEELKREISRDITEVTEQIFDDIRAMLKRKKKNEKFSIFKWAWILGLILLTFNFLLFNFWLLRWLIKSLFF